MKTQIITFGIVGLFSLMGLFPTLDVKADTWSGNITANNWTYDYITAGYSNGPEVRNIKFNGDFIFKRVNVPWFMVSSGACGLYGLTPDANYPYPSGYSTAGGVTTIQYKYTTDVYDASYCSYSHLNEIDVYFYLTSTGDFKVKVYTDLDSGYTANRGHYAYYTPQISTTSSADTSQYAFLESGTPESYGISNQWLHYRSETSNYMDEIEYVYNYPEVVIQSGTVYATSAYAYSYWWDYSPNNDNVYNQVYINKCNSGSPAYCGDTDPSGGQNTNGPWDYDTGEDIYGTTIHLVTRQDTYSNTRDTLTTEVDWAVVNY